MAVLGYSSAVATRPGVLARLRAANRGRGRIPTVLAPALPALLLLAFTVAATADPPGSGAGKLPHMAMRVAVVSPEQEVWSGEAEMVSARTLDGEIGVLEGHVPLLGVLADSGEVRIKTGGSEVVAKVSGGFLSVTHTGVSILAERAELA